jgi:hypothetical protein
MSTVLLTRILSEKQEGQLAYEDGQMYIYRNNDFEPFMKTQRNNKGLLIINEDVEIKGNLIAQTITTNAELESLDVPCNIKASGIVECTSNLCIPITEPEDKIEGSVYYNGTSLLIFYDGEWKQL